MTCLCSLGKIQGLNHVHSLISSLLLLSNPPYLFRQLSELFPGLGSLCCLALSWKHGFCRWSSGQSLLRDFTYPVTQQCFPLIPLLPFLPPYCLCFPVCARLPVTQAPLELGVLAPLHKVGNTTACPWAGQGVCGEHPENVCWMNKQMLIPSPNNAESTLVWLAFQS